MKVSGWLASLACGAMLVGQLAMAGYANAQEVTVGDSEGSHGVSVASSPAVQTPPADVSGCWSGTIDDDAFGIGDGFFQFTQNKNGRSIVKKASRFDFEWPDAFAFSPVSGTVKGSALKIHGNAGHCPINFVGVINQAGDEITGTYQFLGKCHTQEGFAQGNFDVTPSGCN